ncbi:MAG: class D sortase [Oscillospiraceae bacterium]|jgi:LPXTG-site transpeptidase (sortase) family protein|nr:class D sortase [Oscillospiraceae bacterium]
MRKVVAMVILFALTFALSATVLAADYTFDAKDTTSYYKSTDYADIYAVEYNYGSVNVVDFDNRGELPGLFMPTPQNAPSGGGMVISVSYETEYAAPNDNFVVATAFTAASPLTRSDGSIGTLEIPSLKISMRAFEGTGSDSMAKGVGHFAESSAWNGNIALAGHNRGAAYTIGTIKDLRVGDTIKYTTLLGTRTYAVSFVRTISSTDWTHTAATSDNRITLFTCLADQPTLRVCVQAVEVT